MIHESLHILCRFLPPRLPLWNGWGSEFSYPAATSFVQYLIRERGLDRLLEVVENLGKGSPADAAMTRVYGKGYSELAHDWGDSLARGQGMLH